MRLSDKHQFSTKKIKNIIFDWGGVLTDIDFQASIKAFKDLGIEDFENHYTLLKQGELFVNFEKGLLSPDEFRKKLKEQLPVNVTDKQIDDAWKAMLLDLPVERWELLKKVKTSYRTFILSNTNLLHVEWYFKILEKKYGTYGYSHLFEKVYFSYELGMRKPDRDIYEHVISDSQLIPEETLFIDDSPLNIETADSMGIQTYCLKKPETLLNLFENGTR